MFSVKKTWQGKLNGRWIEAQLCDTVVEFVLHWSEKTDIPVQNFLNWLGLSSGKYHAWKQRFGTANRHNGLTP
ncbi:MAG: hypothetical protein L0Y39_09090, partial [Methylococcaceae bacterium]|nr:hypothetical protein [Methylococcaceae bacterium]